jgi:hypothetical protein
MSKVQVNDEITKRIGAWARIQVLLDYCEPQIAEFCIKMEDETQSAFENRKAHYVRAFIDPVMDMVVGPADAIFSNGVAESYSNSNSMLSDFAKDVAQGANAVTLQQYLHDFVMMSLSAYGNSIVVVDKPPQAFKFKDAERASGMPYLYSIDPWNVVDWLLGENGFDIFIYKMDFELPAGDVEEGEEIETVIYEGAEVTYDKEWFVVRDGEKIVYEFQHNFGFVPVVWETMFLSSQNKVVGISSMFQTSNMILAANDRLTNAHYELDKHGAAKLYHPEGSYGSTTAVTDQKGFVVNKPNDGNVRMEGKDFPEFLVKALETNSQVELGLLYMKFAFENEKSQKSMAKMGADGVQVAESGISKIVDMVPLKNKLTSLALKSEATVHKIMDYVSKMLKVVDDHTFGFDKEYDLTPLEQKYIEIEKAISTGIYKMSETAFKNQVKAIDKNFAMDQDQLIKINKEIDSFSSEDDLVSIISKQETEEE